MRLVSWAFFPGLLFFALTACRRPEPLRHLPLVRPEMISLGGEARPARSLPDGNALTWSVPSSAGGVVELACGLSPAEAGPATSAEFRVYRVRASRKTLLGERTLRPSLPAAWVPWTVEWKAHSSPVSLVIEVDCRSAGKPLADPLARPALLAEPILVPARGASTEKENAVIFLVDTLRADRLGCYGDRSASTPEADRLAREGLRINRVVSPSNWTLPAHASLFTSASVSRHLAGGLRRALGRELPTLAETLEKSGYRTLAVTNGGFVDPSFGIARGFDRYLTVDIKKEDVRASVARALELVRPYAGQPVFLFFHTYQVHQYPHELGKPPDEIADAALLSRLMSAKYDEEVGRADAALGDLRRGLEKLGLAERTALLFTSDHGEMLNDRPETIKTMIYGHSHPYLHDEENRVPLLFYDPRRPAKGRVIEGPASLLDVAPTVLETLGLPPNPSFEGAAVSRLGRDPAFARSRTLVTEEPHNECLSMERGGEKLILRPARAFRSLWWGKPYGPIAPLEGYDLGKDPGERRDLGPSLPGSAALREAADRDVAEHFPGSIVVRVPARAPEVSLSFRADSGLRRAMLFGARAEDEPPTIDPSGIATVKVPSGGSDVWISVQPNRALDLVKVDVVSASPLNARLGDGEPAPEGERRLRWEALLPKAALPEGGSPLLYASSLRAGAEEEAAGSSSSPENVEQLRSLGYLNMPWKEAGTSSAGAAHPSFRGPGPDILIVTVSTGRPR